MGATDAELEAQARAMAEKALPASLPESVRAAKLPAIIEKGGETAPWMISPITGLSRSPGLGRYTCCDRNHVMVDPVSGKETSITCECPSATKAPRSPPTSNN